MYKQFLLNSIIKEMKICRRLYSRIPADQMDFRPREDVRSTLDLLRYLGWCGTGMIQYWYSNDGLDFRTSMAAITAPAKAMEAGDFIKTMDGQIELIQQLFANISDEDLATKEITYPWGAKDVLGQGILETSVKWLTAYKLQLFLYIKYSTGQAIVTADAWVKTEIEEAI